MNLRIPGPIPVHPRVMAAMNQPMINHRGPRFSAIFGEVADGLRWAFQTTQEVLVLTSSGTGGLEAAVANTVSPGDRVLSLSIGNFGERLRTLARIYGGQVTALDAPAGQPIDVAHLSENIRRGAVMMPTREKAEPVLNMDEWNREAIIRAGWAAHGNLTEMAQLLGISRTTLWRKMQFFKLDARHFQPGPADAVSK